MTPRKITAAALVGGLIIGSSAFAFSGTGVPVGAGPFGPNCYKFVVDGHKYAIEMTTFASVAQAVFVDRQADKSGSISVVGTGHEATSCIDADGGFHEAVWYVY